MSQEITIRVLLVDDNEMVRFAMRIALTIYDDIELVGEAGDGQQAISLCEQLQPDVILMDMIMPVMNGIMAAHVIRKRYPDICILILSSSVDNALIDAVHQAGVQGYLFKDSKVAAIVETIRKVYRQRSV